MSGAQTSRPGAGPLAGIRAVEIGGGVGGAWCGRMLADLGVEVLRVEPEGGDPLRRRREIADDPRTEGLLHAWLDHGKTAAEGDLDALVADADLLILGEEAARPALASRPRAATVDLRWFAAQGPRATWAGSDAVVQALIGMIYVVGPKDGPPQQLGDLQASMVGGVFALHAALAALYAGGRHRGFEVGILESNLCLSELAMADSIVYDRKCERLGVNRFFPTCPVSSHLCADGRWLGITVLTPAQWAAFCEMLDLPEWATDPGLATIQLRGERADEIEAEIDRRLKAKTAEEWAALGRKMRVPMAVIPDAETLINHPIFGPRGLLQTIEAGGRGLVAPRSPIRVADTGGGGEPLDTSAARDAAPGAPLTGLRVADFSMGWAGPLITRILADLGAEVIKIEAGRYPDWWRGTLWDAESIARRQYEESRRFTALNRGKKSVSLDLTTDEGKRLAKALVDASQLTVENHAASVMDRLGMGWESLSKGRDDLVMISASAFGGRNEWSDTRAYGSTLEHASGLPSFRGDPSWPPTMGHIAYGDPIGGLYGAAAALAALVHRKRGGKGQWVNMSQVECLVPFAAAAMLTRGATGAEPPRIRNRHAVMAPHGIYPGAGEDRWIHVAAQDDAAWATLARTIGREDLAGLDLAARRAREDELDAAVAAWTATQDILDAAEALQAAGVAAAPVLTPEETLEDAHLAAVGAHLDIERPHVGVQRQFSLSILEDGARKPPFGPAPLLGADTHDVLTGILGVEETAYQALVTSGVISLRPTALRAAAPAAEAAVPAE
ncbi:CoA transferase [Albimonas sp. CAU 1670]|uniref:CaiB/BaiF CoA-transferase family protein n=1 Tax=Albimonas sp. CAU 1670 TaxID=3032599 RepID=UPI0023DB5430|nr:CoA transferase [Albimonas sp. CAU 1670]MDF2233634.1 CoA transferase [Albimonas sp. CAU 1670]